MRKSTVALSVRICALAIGLWLAFAGVLTWAVAEDFQNQIYRRAESFTQNKNRMNYSSLDISKDTSGYQTLQQFMRLGEPYYWLRAEQLLPIVMKQMPDSYGSDDWYYGQWELLYGYQAAMVFFDEAGKPMMKSGNLMSLYYITEENWQANNTVRHGAAYIDLDKLPEDVAIPRSILWDTPYSMPPLAGHFGWMLRSTGYFVGDEFVPICVDAAELYDSMPDELTVEKICSQDHQGGIRWRNCLDLAPPQDAQLVTIYIPEAGYYQFDPKSFGVDGKSYASLVEYVQEQECPGRSGNLVESVFTLTGKASEETGADTFRLAVRIKPLRYAMLRLVPVYLVSSLLIGLFLWLLLRSIRNQLTFPLENMSMCMESGIPLTPNSGWKDVRQVEAHMQQTQDQIRSLQNEKQQLQSSLEYARHAEENRRQLVSNITHELKTPLAVIHSYAEGLQAGIAEEKREHYLSTILEETEKMDAMVLEMLDLSRLEAGKVRLSTDHFSLRALTEGILNKLAPEESRSQKIIIRSDGDCMISADEGRIAQVVTNLISNALRYTPETGCIWLQMKASEGLARFSITNHAEHLSAEALEKVFDSFYCVDASRSSKGTGLGLPIARSIIQLHRGSLTVKNTWVNFEPCLEFSFELPLK